MKVGIDRPTDVDKELYLHFHKSKGEEDLTL